MPTRLPLRPLASIVPLALVAACATVNGRSTGTRDYAYARARDSIVVAVSTRGRSGDALRRALESAVTRAAGQEGCEPGPVQLRGDRDPRLADDAVAYLESPRGVGVASCTARLAR